MVRKTSARSWLIFVLIVVLIFLLVRLLTPRLTRDAPQPQVLIQDGKTIDFSSGKPVVKDSAKEREIMATSVQEMNTAAGEVTFRSTAPADPKK